MTSPASPPPPVPKKRNTLVVGCLVALLALVVGAIAFVVLAVFLAKRELDAMTPEQRAAMETAKLADYRASRAAELAPTLAAGAEAQARLAMATRGVAKEAKASPCPPDPARPNIPVDAEWFRTLAGNPPREPIGTPWMRHDLFGRLADQPRDTYNSDENMALAMSLADRELSDAGTIAVIHTTKLVIPKLVDSTHFDGGYFEGYVQLLKYPGGESICMAPFRAESSEKIGGGLGIGLRVRGIRIPLSGAMPKKEPQQQVEEDFQGRFWAAEEAALGK